MSKVTRVRIAWVLVAGAVLGSGAGSGTFSNWARGQPKPADPPAAKEKAPPPGSPGATTTIDGKYLPNPPAFGGVINPGAKDSKPYWPPRGRPAQGGPERPAHHDRRPGVRRLGHVRRRRPDAGDGPGRQGRAAVHALPLDGALLADAGGPHHRPQPSLGRLRGDLRTGHRVPGLRLDHRPRRRRPSARS